MSSLALTAANQRALKLERWLTILLGLAVLNTGYLGWRYIALHAGWVAPGTGLCSWTASVDCDKVLLTPDARAFYVPNAVLGFGFFLGCFIWWMAGQRLDVAYRHHVARTLAFWLAVATLFTFRFFWLLAHLDAFCPLCPWNHILTYASLVTALMLWRATPRPLTPRPVTPLVRLVALCVAQFWFWQVLWFVASARGWI